MRAMREKDRAFLQSIPLAELQSGTSEMKSWISAAGTGTAQGMYWWDVKIA